MEPAKSTIEICKRSSSQRLSPEDSASKKDGRRPTFAHWQARADALFLHAPAILQENAMIWIGSEKVGLGRSRSEKVGLKPGERFVLICCFHFSDNPPSPPEGSSGTGSFIQNAFFSHLPCAWDSTQRRKEKDGNSFLCVLGSLHPCVELELDPFSQTIFFFVSFD